MLCHELEALARGGQAVDDYGPPAARIKRDLDAVCGALPMMVGTEPEQVS